MKNFKIATSTSLYDIDYDGDYDEELHNLYELQKRLIDFDALKYYILRKTKRNNTVYCFLDYSCLEELCEQSLTIKDGIDVVSLEDGTLAIVAYCNDSIEMLEFREVPINLYDELSKKGSKELVEYFK